jgi:glycosyltransferase involved in cell wall biosynthesis
MIKKICYVDEDGRFGGPQQRMLIIASELKKKDIDVEVIIPKDETEIFKKKLLENKIKFHELTITRLSLKINFLFKYIFLFFYEIFILIKFFKHNKYDLIQANSTSQFKAVIAAFLLKLKIVWVIEDSYFPFIIVFIFKQLAKISNCKIIYTSERVYDFYFKNEKKINNSIKEIFAPVDYFKFNINQSFAVPDYINKKNYIITTVAAMVPVKGLEYFIESAEIVRKNNSNVSFIIAGAEISSQKKYSKKIKSMLSNKDYIKYIGMCNNIPKLLANSDIFVCSSLSEAGPITVYEAMFMKLPIITTDVGACNQIITNYENGIIVPIKDSNKISQAVIKVLNDTHLRNKIGLNAHKFALEFFSLDKIVKQYIEFYNK